ncbi:hypothetical protein E0Z10_g9121 [Xylaria hypoxylon]|uniref:Gfd2/YDR514C-like C-terminal domain-containing protein n=1 Tax=Xylaria hypoxylon TaxID=37992 RepID=A0A4Z0Y778_9PEZI|nr:hypothetical protein E0Z10_g9121 [Xylaria hypoxylon]
MSITPPEFLPVLLGHGSFLKNADGTVRLDENRKPLYVIPPADDFLEMKPSKESQQFWPARDTQIALKKASIVLFNIAVSTDCQRPDTITEIGYTIFNTAAIYDGAKGSRKKRVPGCMAPGPRGENITKLGLSRHYIVQDTADHHPGSCNSPAHTAQPYHFSYRKSSFIKRGDIMKTLEEAFDKAAYEGFPQADVNNKENRRVVVLVGWGHENHHPQIKATSWYKNNHFFQQWDIRRHPLVLKRIPNPSYLTCLDVFGIQHQAHGKEIAHNAGNRSAFTLQLLIALCFLTEEQRTRLKSGLNLEPNPRFPGVESVLARDNRPPGSPPLPPGRVAILH